MFGYIIYFLLLFFFFCEIIFFNEELVLAFCFFIFWALLFFILKDNTFSLSSLNVFESLYQYHFFILFLYSFIFDELRKVFFLVDVLFDFYLFMFEFKVFFSKFFIDFSKYFIRSVVVNLLSFNDR